MYLKQILQLLSESENKYVLKEISLNIRQQKRTIKYNILE